MNKVVYDSNVFVAAAFNPHSSSARLAKATRATLVTNDEHLLAVAVQLSVPVLAPRAAAEALS